MSGILDQIMGQLGGSEVDKIAQQIGADREQTQSAISAAVPTMIEALGRSTGKGTSMTDLYAKLGMGASPESSTGASAPAGLDLGSLTNVLGGLFGQKQGHIEKSIGKSSGLSAAQIAPLLAILGPIVMGVIANKARASDNADPHDILQEERENIRKSGGGSMLGRLFDQDGDGDFDLSDVMKLGMSKLFSRK